jgi:hypothetical protein
MIPTVPRAIAAALGSLAVFTAGCGSSGEVAPPQATPRVFYEPPSFCVDGPERLTVYNLGDGPLEWTFLEMPEGASGLSPTRTVAPGTISHFDWTWSPPGTGTVVDSFVVDTGDPELPRVVIVARRPAAGAQIAPDAPWLLSPADGAVFSPADSVVVAWSDLDTCPVIAHYRFRLGPGVSGGAVTGIVLSGELPASVAVIDIEPGDAGTVYWQVQGVTTSGLTGPWSAIRGWTVIP